jgi:hypothetical protein
MGRKSDDPVLHIVSFRVNAEEKQMLERLADDLGLSVSQMVRKYFQAAWGHGWPGAAERGRG